MSGNKRLSLPHIIASVICVVFTIEGVSPMAAIGNAQLFWWLVLIPTFLLPYGMAVSELGTAYPHEGGIYHWVRRAFGKSWGARTAYYYWVNYPVWISSLSLLFPAVIRSIFGVNLDFGTSLFIELGFVWAVVIAGFMPLSESKGLLTVGTVVKVGISLLTGVMGIGFALKHGFAIQPTLQSFLPDPARGGSALGYLSVILFNFMGFEVICSFSDSMAKPKRDIPRAILVGGLAVAGVCVLSSFGITAVTPPEAIAEDLGLINAVGIVAGRSALLTRVVAIGFLATVFAGMAIWAMGVCRIACEAAEQKDMPAIFGRVAGKDRIPVGAAIMNGLVASATLCLRLIPMFSDGIFWIIFSSNVIFLLMSYMALFPALLRLRKVDPNRPRPYRVPLTGWPLYLLLAVPTIELVLVIGMTTLPLNAAEVSQKLPILLCVLTFVVLGEIMRVISSRRS
ncbi:APC family permease [Collinsella sp. AGMB00827]|uniref:APC family permease n=1 Tax=Collinsella ureilytica TaxID=2869515 RepID=A0ABS7MKK7_9ACTN|nr:APC family permease [Collinsella urealyticum]MBY4797620.1 APC family permease [Collinsella urealyticum]